MIFAPLVAGTVSPTRVDRTKALIVVAHPDDESVLAATAYRISRELFGIVDQVVITDGAGGYRYASLAGTIYGVEISGDAKGRNALAEIRRQETRNAGRILGVRRQQFLKEPDPGFEGCCADAACDWDNDRIRTALKRLLARERYDVVFVLLPRPEVHRHHQLAALLVLEAVAALPDKRRPLVLGAEAGSSTEAVRPFLGLKAEPLTRTAAPEPAFGFDRNTRFGHAGALNYHIVVNWVITEHKSQGLFQADCGKYDLEQFWVFAVGNAPERVNELARRLEVTETAESPQDSDYSAGI